MDVIYVSPVPISDEILQYYSRLIGLAPAVHSGNTDDQADFSSRFKIITVEASKPFQVCVVSYLCIGVFLFFTGVSRLFFS